MIQKFISKILGSQNERELKQYRKRVLEINALEAKYQNLSNEELQAGFAKLRAKSLEGVLLDELLNDSFAITREVGKRVLNMRHFDVQLIGGMVLHDGKIAEMKTGEGKTLVATLAVVLNAMTGKGVHVVTVNDYLAKRDSDEMGQIYKFLGYSVGVIYSDEYDESVKKIAYDADITYGTNNEFGFDYLRDNMKYSKALQVQRSYNFAIVDEVDSILIDEARTPLIISGPAKTTMALYEKSNEVALALVKEADFTVDEKNRIILLTDKGLTKAEELYGVNNLYEMENAALSHRLDQALKANHLFARDVDYIVRNDEVVIVDEFTGRLSEGKRFSEGMHQALEAKEGVLIKEESQTLADITFQNYFRLYKKLAGMTGTAQTEATEFAEIYGLDVISIPTNVAIVRKDLNDLIYKTEEEKFEALLEQVKKVNTKGQPILIGTASIDKSEIVHNMLVKAKIPHTVLNAKNHEKEAEIIKQAGLKGAVTVATNMAGRGVDVRLGDGVRELGGLAILGTERHESRRIDNQLRGRSGRQGDVGISQFFLSLDDTLLRIFGSDKIKGIMNRLGLERGECIDSKIVTNAVEKAQKRVESMNYESRKHLLEYDDVANAQRKIIYTFRNELLDEDYQIASKIEENRIKYASHLLDNAGIFAGGDNFDLEKLNEIVEEDCGIKVNIQGKEYDNLLDSLLNALTESYETKMSVLEQDRRKEIERILILQILDETWREHLYQMDILKTGIGLRGYNQKDPLTEYKKESYRLFSELIDTIRTSTMRTLHSIRFEESREAHKEEEKQEEAVKIDDKRKKRQDAYEKKKSQ
ncbi:MAG: preprotein translocase subunit [Pseudomonadota bacterium]|jgi:preprotein translocase subunit SecA